MSPDLSRADAAGMPSSLTVKLLLGLYEWFCRINGKRQKCKNSSFVRGLAYCKLFTFPMTELNRN